MGMVNVFPYGVVILMICPKLSIFVQIKALSELYMRASFWDIEFMFYTFIYQTFTFLLPVIMPPHTPYKLN